jgi:anti-sigma factor (TIGR02949 family)
MRCVDCNETLDAYLDGELMPDETRTVRDHIAICPECSRAYDALAATSHLLQEGLVHYSAPDVLKARIRSAVTQPDSYEPRPRAGRTQWVRLAAAGVAIALASSAATLATVRQGAATRSVPGEVLASHVRSLMPGHLTDVVSNDQHNVKPWFNGRLNLSPQVPALDSAGFVLVGGRLDYLAGRPVAAVVYSRRQHIINVFSWPDAGGDAQESETTAQGYHLVHWRTDHVDYWIVSDLNASALSQFVTLFRRGGGESTRPQ